MVTIRYSAPALNDLKNIHDYIAQDSKLSAKRFVRLLTDYIKTFKRFPEAGQRIFPDRYENLRQRLFKSYRIIYQFENDEISVITIQHQTRLIENIESLKNLER